MENAIKIAMGFSWMEKLTETEGETVNKNFIVNTDKGKFFIKWNSLPNSKEVFQTEYHGLKLLEAVNVIRTPKPYAVGQVSNDDKAFIVLELLEHLQPLTTCSIDFAQALARLHQHNIDEIRKPVTDNTRRPVIKFGSEEKVFFGPHFCIPENTWYDRWDEYFIKEIMEPQFTFSQKNLEDKDLSNSWEQLKPKVSLFFRTIDVFPSLCLGDVASDNTGQIADKPVLFDPYCFYGHYEFDLTQPYLLNDFTPVFYEAYFRVMPQEQGHANRRMLYRLFACMVRHNYGMDGYLEKTLAELQEIDF